jgi:hypothetical protein
MRLDPLTPGQLSDTQRPLFESMKAGVSAKYSNFVTTRADGALLGPGTRGCMILRSDRASGISRRR